MGRESPLVQLLNKFLNTQVALSPLASRRSQANVAKFKWLERNARLFSMMMMTMGVKVLGTGELVGILAQHF